MPVPVGLVVAGAQIGMSLFEGLSRSSDEKDLARQQYKSVQVEIKALKRHKEQLENLYSLRGKQITDEYGNRRTSLIDSLNLNLADIEKQYETGASRTNMAYSGGIDRNRLNTVNEVRTQTENNITSLYDLMGRDLTQLEMSKASEIGQIDVSIASLNEQSKMYKKAAGIASDTFDVTRTLKDMLTEVLPGDSNG